MCGKWISIHAFTFGHLNGMRIACANPTKLPISVQILLPQGRENYLINYEAYSEQNTMLTGMSPLPPRKIFTELGLLDQLG